MVADCVNPGDPKGGRSLLTAYYPKPKTAPSSDPPFVEAVDAYSAQCVSDAQGALMDLVDAETRTYLARGKP